MAIKQRVKSLSARDNNLSDTFYQLKVLTGQDSLDARIPAFASRIKESGYVNGICPTQVEIFQINIGKLCNQACAHCHVDAGPDKKAENMDKATLEKCLDIISQIDAHTVDITGGAPEMNPHLQMVC